MERDLHEQDELVAGKRAGQLFPRGARELRKPKGMGNVVTKAGAVQFNPRVSQIIQAANTGRLSELLARRFASGGSVESDPVAWGAIPLRASLSFDDLVPGAYLLESLRAAGIRKAEDMFRDALLNPERAKYYLSQVPPKLDGGAGFTLSRSIRRELMMAPVLTPSRTEDVSKRKAELVKKSLSRPSVLAPAQGR